MSRKVDVHAIKTDGAADKYYEDLEKELATLKQKYTILDAEVIMRETDGGDLLQLIDEYKERNAALKAKLNPSIELASPKGKSPSTIPGAELNPAVVEFGTWWLQLHMGLEAEARASQNFTEDMRSGGALLIQLLKGLTEQYKADPGAFTTVDGHLVPKAWADVQSYRDHLQGAFDTISRKMLGKVTGDPVYLAQQITDAFDKLWALPASTTLDESIYIDVLGKEAGIRHASGEDFKRFAERVVNRLSVDDTKVFFDTVERLSGLTRTTGETFDNFLRRSFDHMQKKGSLSTFTSQLNGVGRIIKIDRNTPDEDNTVYEGRLHTELRRLVGVARTRATGTTGDYSELLGEIGAAIGCMRNDKESDTAYFVHVKDALSKLVGDYNTYNLQHEQALGYCKVNKVPGVDEANDTLADILYKACMHFSGNPSTKGNNVKSWLKTAFAK